MRTLIPSRLIVLRLLPLYRTTACLVTVVPLIGISALSGRLETMKLLGRRDRRWGKLTNRVARSNISRRIGSLGLKLFLCKCLMGGAPLS